jgi:UDP-glucose 4-epimerase
MKKIIITGAGGYIGSVAAYLFLQKGYEVIGLDNYSRGYKQPLEVLQEKFGEEKFRYYDVDLRNDLSPIFEKEKDITAIVHYAALCKVPESMQDPGLYFSNDTWGCANLVDMATKNGIKYFVFSSTCATYGESQYVPIDEKHPTNPISPYGESKLMAEKIVQWYGQLKDLNYVMLRYFNVCGASDDALLGDSKKPSFHLMQNAVRGAMGIEPFQLVCPKVDTPDGTPIRDYVNVVDLNEAHVLALEYLMNGGKSDIINLGTGTGNSVLEIVHKVEEVTGKKIDITEGPTRAGDPARLFANNDKAKQVLGWNPKRTIEDSVRSLVKWYEQHPHGWER